MRGGRQAAQILQRTRKGFGCEFDLVLVNDFVERFDEMRASNRRGCAMFRRYRPAECTSERLVDLAGFGQMIERLAFVEAAHLYSPLDRFAPAAKREIPAKFGSDGHNPTIDRRCECPIDRNLGFTGRPAFLERGKIEKWKPYRPFDLECPLSGQKHRSSMGVDAPDRCSAMTGGIAQEVDHRLLRTACRHTSMPLPACPCRTAASGAAL